MIHQPPDDVAPEALFRLLLQTPRPSKPVAIVLPGGAGGLFRVRAVTGAELFGARDDATSLPERLRQDEVGKQLISLGLYQGSERVFASADELGLLDSDDYVRVANIVLPALQAISPVFGLSDVGAWEGRLLAGAQHHSNRHTAELLAGCREQRTITGVRGGNKTYKTVTIDRPDRFFGLPLGQLTDGHQLCYRAAKRMHENRT